MSYRTSDKLTQMGAEVIAAIPELQYLQETDARITYRVSSKSKMDKGAIVRAQCIPVQELYQEYCPYEYMIMVYEPNIQDLNDKQMRILMEHELLHIHITYKADGTPHYGTTPHDYEDFKQIIDKYGTDWDRA